jgi:tRNA-intron endonuclease
MPLELKLEGKTLKAVKAEDFEVLRKSFYGSPHKGQITLDPEEVLYLMDVRNATVADETGKQYGYNDIAEMFMKEKLFAEYSTYKDWRERGLVIRRISDAKGTYKKNPIVKYPPGSLKLQKIDAEGLFFEDDRITVVEDAQVGKRLYEDYWLGQFGSYKAEDRGRLLKLDQFETLFLMENAGLKLRNMEKEKLSAMLSKDPDFDSMYEVYEDWRLRGFVLKTGFKFGTHFRIYFPGASPTKKGEWVHSKHVIHVFPRTKKLIIAEWARAIRVAHSVRKTFILAIPGKRRKPAKTSLNFLLYHRISGGIETPDKYDPSFAMLSLSEDELIGGAELAGAIEDAKQLGLDLMLAIADRETAVTYYRVKRIELPGSKYEYYEIEWAQP